MASFFFLIFALKMEFARCACCIIERKGCVLNEENEILAAIALGATIFVTIAMAMTCGVGIGMRIQLKRDQNFMKGMKSMTVSFQGDTSLDDWYEYIKWENS